MIRSMEIGPRTKIAAATTAAVVAGLVGVGKANAAGNSIEKAATPVTASNPFTMENQISVFSSNIEAPACTPEQIKLIKRLGSNALPHDHTWKNYMGAPYWPYVTEPEHFNTLLKPSVKGTQIQRDARLSNREMTALREADVCVAPFYNGLTWKYGFSSGGGQPNVHVNYVNNVPAGGLNAFYKIAKIDKGSTTKTLVAGTPGCGNFVINEETIKNYMPPNITTPNKPTPVTPGIHKNLFYVTTDSKGNLIEKREPVPGGLFVVDAYNVTPNTRYNPRTHKLIGGRLIKHSVVTILNNPAKGERVPSGPQGSSWLFVERDRAGYDEHNRYAWYPKMRGDNNPQTIDFTHELKNVQKPKDQPTPEVSYGHLAHVKTADETVTNQEKNTVTTREIDLNGGEFKLEIYEKDKRANGYLQTGVMFNGASDQIVNVPDSMTIGGKGWEAGDTARICELTDAHGWAIPFKNGFADFAPREKCKEYLFTSADTVKGAATIVFRFRNHRDRTIKKPTCEEMNNCEDKGGKDPEPTGDNCDPNIGYCEPKKP